uniref:RING-type E3 ubiquitin transferase n=1 Tax=Periophthalmus magnuspinnatus TaxID=409849 RepID=A0A3B4ACH5_9GOBI
MLLKGPLLHSLNHSILNLLECKVCFKDFNQDYKPRHLLCGHVLCQECVLALAHPVLRKLECPFCRQLCTVDHTSNCQVLSDLQEMLLLHESRCALPPYNTEKSLSLETKLGSMSAVLGGWGTLINPVGLDVLGSLETIVIVHDGTHRVVVLSSKGKILNRFGSRGRDTWNIIYPLDVAVCPMGHVVITDGGDRAVKIYTSRGTHIITIKASFQLPWGVDTDSGGNIIVSDTMAGSLFQIKVDYCNSVDFECHTAVTNLENPKAVACVAVNGNIATVEHLKSNQHTRLKVFTNDFHIVYQNDSSSIRLQYDVCIHLSAVTFDPNGDVIVVDNSHGTIWSLGKPWHGSVPVPLVSANLIRPVALKFMNNKLIILDSGDHTVKIYNAASETGSTSQ